MAILVDFRLHYGEIQLLQALRQRADGAVPDRAMIHFDNGAHLGGGTDEERLVTNVKFRAVDGSLYDIDAELFLREPHDRVAGNPLENAGGHGRCNQLSVP